MEVIRDMLYVKSIERTLGRALTEEELDGDAHRVVFPNGSFTFIQVPILRFPLDLLSALNGNTSGPSLWEEMEEHAYEAA